MKTDAPTVELGTQASVGHRPRPLRCHSLHIIEVFAQRQQPTHKSPCQQEVTEAAQEPSHNCLLLVFAEAKRTPARGGNL